METNYDENELLEIIKLNEQTVSNALATLKSNATEREISDYISNYTGQPRNLVAREVIGILRFAVDNGFLLKNGNTYTITSREHIYNLDCESCENGRDQTDDNGKSGKSEDEAKSGNEPYIKIVELDNIVDSNVKHVNVKDKSGEGNENTCVDDVKEEVILPGDLKELMDWWDYSDCSDYSDIENDDNDLAID